MADFEFYEWVAYDLAGNFNRYLTGPVIPGTPGVTAGSPTGTFTPGGNYLGVVEINGIPVPVFDVVAEYWVFNPSLDQPTYPATLPTIEVRDYTFYEGYFNYQATLGYVLNLATNQYEIAGNGSSGAIVDLDGDYQFESGDTFGGPFLPPTYRGTVTIDGVEMPIFGNLSVVSVYVPVGTGTLTVPSVLPTVTSTPYTFCFAEGTLIAVPDGARAVETLGIGDCILTADGRSVVVKWIGRQTISTRFGPARRLRPVRVRAGALGEGVPVRDLVLTADHALLLDGLLVNAGALVNGSGIDWVPLAELGDRYTVYHVETEDHDIILAEGAPAETFIDYLGRQAFDNYAEYVAFYGAERVIAESVYPRISAARLVPPAIRARLAGRCAA